MSLTFDVTQHRYYWHGRPVPGVTSIIERAGLGVDLSYVEPAVRRRKAELGTAVHAACVAAVTQNLILTTYEAEAAGYVEGFCQFLDDTGFRPMEMEVPLFHGAYGYCGTPDAWGLLNDRLIIIDLKTPLTVSRKSWTLQVAGGYKPLICFNRPQYANQSTSGVALQLKSSGTYKLVPCDDPIAEQTFLACLAEIRGRGTSATTQLIAQWRAK